jgi:hypothetical protein
MLDSPVEPKSEFPRVANAPVRIQRKRTKGWRMPESTVYVGRPSAFGNPYYISEDCQHISWFRADLLKESAAKAPTSDHPWGQRFWKMSRLLPTLRGKNLACWCALDQPCHADVLLEIANR